MRVALGPSLLMKFLLPGLFHPARKVRAAYWKVYNSVYMGSQAALVPAFPRVPDDERNKFARPELDLLI